MGNVLEYSRSADGQLRQRRPVRYTFAVLCCVLALVGLQTGCDLLGNPREKAAALLAKGELNEARIEATNAIQKDENDAEAYLILARVLAAQGDLVTAERTLTRALERGGDVNLVDALRARTLLRIQDYPRILSELKPLPGHRGETLALVHAVRGRAELAMRKREDAGKSLEAALAVGAEVPEVQVLNGHIAFIDGKADEALAIVDRALAKTPGHVSGWETKAAMLRMQGKIDDAIAAYDRAAAADPNDASALISAAQLAIQAKRLDVAEQKIQAAAKRAPNTLSLRHTQAMLLFEREQYDKALVALQDILRAQPKFVPAIILAAMTHLQRGEPNQAETLLRPMAQSGNVPLRRLYATALLRMGDARAALDALKPLLSSEAVDASLLTLAAEVATTLKDHTQATAYYERAAALTPESSGLLALAGISRLAGGESVKGLEALEKASGLSGESIGADAVLAVTHLQRGEYAKALAAARKIQAKTASSPVGFHLAGGAYLGLKDAPAARKQFERAVEIDPAYWPAVNNLARLDVLAGQKDAARARIERVLARDRGNVEAAVALAGLTGDQERLVSHLEAVRSEDAKALRARIILAQLYVERGRGDQALAIAREAAAIAPQRADAQELLGLTQFAAGRNSEALTTLRDLATKQPALASVQMRLAQVHTALDDLTSAEAAYRKVLSLQAGNLEALRGLAGVLARQKRVDDALKIAAEIRTAQPKLALGHLLAGDVNFGAKRYGEAIKAYEAAQMLQPSGDLVVKMHLVRVAAGEKPGEAMLLKWLGEHPADASVRMHLGTSRYLDGRYKEAAEQFETIVKADPRHGYALNNLASTYLKLEDPRALERAEAALRLLPDDADVLDTYGLAHTRFGKPALAVEALRKAVNRRPGNVAYRVNYALALAKTGDHDGARKELTTLIDDGKGSQLTAEAKALLQSN
jgi:putative PEP-CTERM system TPR-repeat lipoprotein